MHSHQQAELQAAAVVIPPHLRTSPSKLFVETTTRCNLGCFMCVKQAGSSGVTEGDLAPATFAALEPAFLHLEALVLNGIGEPLLNPHLEEFIRRARRAMPATGWIGFQSNGLLLTNLRALSLVAAGLDRICLSIDAASPDTFRRVREGGELLDIEHAFAALVAARERCQRPDFRIGVEFVVMRSNLGELPAALRWAARQGASFAIVTHPGRRTRGAARLWSGALPRPRPAGPIAGGPRRRAGLARARP
ncbi:MAG TPA: radical SAM protein, partial [Geobacteraceae bacterium]